MAKPLTLEEFKASKVFERNYDPFELNEPVPAWLYANKSCFIMGPLPSGIFHLVIENMEWQGELEYLEGLLYHEWYLVEVVHHEG